MRLKVRLGIGAALLGLATLATAALLVVGMARIGDRLDAALAAERRVERYSALSTQVSTFLIVATESIQTQLSPAQRADRLELLTEDILRTFDRLQSDLATAVEEARRLGLDAQSQRATQSIGIARMQALFVAARDGFLSETQDRERLQGFIDIFATGIDPLLNEAVVTEMRFREAILRGIADLRQRLVLAAGVIAALTVALFGLFYLGLVRPQFRRLDLLRDAARRIGQADFAVSLPVDRRDEIGHLFAETNRMADALATREASVADDWARLNDVVAERTEALRAANDRLSRIDGDRRRFFADISHELRTPLTVIRMEAELGRAGAPEPERSFAVIEARAERLNRRIDDLLRVARSETGQLSLDSTEFDLAEVARAATEDLRAEVESAGMVLTVEAEGSAPVTGDRNWTRQVISSLVRNAVRHARGGGQVAVRVTDTGGGDGHTVHVVDNGPGIPPEAADTLFDRFVQGRSDTRAEGFGIGLALARWVVEAQGGAIRLVSPVPPTEALGEAPGTNVAVFLPARAA
ncbi:hypothetical protein SAMN05444413_11454 [Roseivivax marinus]|uniref:sensor histidine kinase n=1 Tax=Roseivivax marinus TaxID=1379903 RepID=UPI0008D34C59|nr:HAMP domain-containing sensor histidine kinase [Roseivivax marinus]SEL71440.1 hypothetical protein SAMN05444413_11454 [Roseivivax marinus]